MDCCRLANGFAYWQGSTIENATYTYFEDVQQALARVQSISGSMDKIEFWTGETGWPSDGTISVLIRYVRERYRRFC